MRIAIDGFEANAEERVGSGVYGFELLHRLREMTRIHYDILLPNKPAHDFPPRTETFQYRVFHSSQFWTSITLPWYLWTHRPRPDVFFSPTHYIPRFSSVPVVVTIFDLSFLQPEFQSFFRERDLWQLKRGTKFSIQHAAHILTISAFSKRAIVKSYKIPSENITVTSLGGNERFFDPIPRVKLAAIRKTYNVMQPFLLFVGTLQPRKNLLRLIDAFYLWGAKHPEVDLLIVGKKGWLYSEIFSHVQKLGIGQSVRFLDYVPDDDLPALMRQAKIFVLPSLYEGFGIPVIEAMASGVPVVASNVSSLPEIVGSAGVLVNPYDVTAIARGIETAWRNSPTLRARGKIRASRYSWDQTARLTLRVLEHIASL